MISDILLPKNICLRFRLIFVLFATILVIQISIFQSNRMAPPCPDQSVSCTVTTCDKTATIENVNATLRPFEYNTTVDFRIIIMTFNRPKALETQLQTIGNLEADGAKFALDIWIDVDDKGDPEAKVVEVANLYHFPFGAKTVHIQPQKAGIFGQWVNTWRPKPHSTELAILLEDDILISPYSWRWLKLVHSKYKDWYRNAGYSLQCGAETLLGPRRTITNGLTSGDITYGYRGMGTWGFAPHPDKWRDFQDWLRNVKDDRFFKPYVDGLIATEWFKSFEQRKFESSMWEMWHICYTHFNNLITIYSHLTPQNITTSNTTGGLCLSVHTREAGLHYSSTATLNATTAKRSLLLNWSNHLELIPKSVKLFHYNGDMM